MATQTTLDLVNYYSGLLIKQYANLKNAVGTIQATVTPFLMPQQSVQTITFSPSPTSGTFILSYSGVNSPAINWNDSAFTIQTDLQTIPTLSQVTVSGSIASGLTVNFVGLTVVAQMLVVANNSLLASSNQVSIVIVETDLTLPLAIQNAFDLNNAVGVQLDILGKYAGVTRTINTTTQTITLNDTDFITLIKFAILQNNSGSSLATIEQNLNQFFPGNFIVTDYKNMYMSYIFSQSIGSPNLFSALVQEKLIPKPMGVGFSVIVPPVVNTFFGYSTYEQNEVNPVVKPYNTYESFNNTWLFLDYKNFIY